MLETFIRRPVLSLVISLLIVFVGLLSLTTLPITQFPDIVPPSVTVTANYTGANAEACTKAVTLPLERAINGVPGMSYMTSTVNNSGLSIITVYFKVGVDPDVAAVSVQNRVATVIDELPEEVIRAGVATEKEVNAMLMYLNIESSDPGLDERFIYNFADINILAELKRIDGVGLVSIMGLKDYAMRIWLKPDRMVAYNISAEEVVEALRAQNVEAAPGRTGQSDGRAENNNPLSYILRYTGKFTRSEEYANIVIRSDEKGAILRLKDVAKVELNSISYEMASKNNGKPAASILIKQRPGSNASQVIASIKDKMEELKASSFPPGMTYSFAYDVSRFLDASIHEVIKTLIEAFILVSLVVFVFLQDWRATLIALISIPVAIIGAFALLPLLGFSINLLTLFALVLAIGIVVDDAIVVVEAVHAKMEEHGVDAYTATRESMREIASAVFSITLVMSAVFVPVAFMSGPVGVFYRQFSLTLAVAIVISGINALTLVPALCALLLKPHSLSHGSGGGFFARFNQAYDRLAEKYVGFLSRTTARRLVTVGALVLFIGLAGLFSNLLPSGFIPTEDQSMIYVNVTTPAGASVERSERVLDQINQAVKAHPDVESFTSLAGYSLLTEVAGSSFGMGMINLKTWEERDKNASEIMAELQARVDSISDAQIEFFPPPTVPGFGNASGFELRLMDRGKSDDLNKLAQANEQFLAALRKRPEIGQVSSSFNPSYPQYLIHIDQEQAAKKGVNIRQATETLQTLIGSYYATNFIRFGQLYKVLVQSGPEYRRQPDDILALHVRNNRGEMVPFGSFLRLERVFGPDQITRYNMYNAAMITGDAAPGYSSGDAIEAIRQVSAQTLPKGMAIDWSGMTREQISSGQQALVIFAICLVFVYLILAAQYESFVLPIPVLLSLPTGIFGAYFFLLITGLENNIYAQVSLVMLIGLLGKNAILIIEFANQKRLAGLNVLDATLQGAAARLRPILMTSFAFVVGLIPLTIATGAGALGNRSIGTAAAGGMLIGTVFGLLVIPGLYYLFASFLKSRPKPDESPLPATSTREGGV